MKFFHVLEETGLECEDGVQRGTEHPGAGPLTKSGSKKLDTLEDPDGQVWPRPLVCPEARD